MILLTLALILFNKAVKVHDVIILKVVMLLLGRGHYSIDVLLAYYVTTRWYNHHHFSSYSRLPPTKRI